MTIHPTDDDRAIPSISMQDQRKTSSCPSAGRPSAGDSGTAVLKSPTDENGNYGTEGEGPMGDIPAMSDRLEDLPAMSDRLEELARPLVRIYERPPSRKMQAKAGPAPMESLTGRAYLEMTLAISRLLSADKKRGSIRAEAIYERLSERACREVRSSHGPSLMSAGGDKEILRIAWTAEKVTPQTRLRCTRGPLLAEAHASLRRLSESESERTSPTRIAEAISTLCENEDATPLNALPSPPPFPLQNHYPLSHPLFPFDGSLPSPPHLPSLRSLSSSLAPLPVSHGNTLSITSPSLSSPPSPSVSSLSPSPAPTSSVIGYTPHGRTQLKEVQEGKSRLSVPIERDWVDDKEEVADVMVVRSWKYRSLSGTGKRLSTPDFVTERLYKAIEQHLPHVAAETVLRRALTYLKYAAVPDPRSGYLPFHEKAVARIRQAPSLARRHEAQVYALAEKLDEALAKDLGGKGAGEGGSGAGGFLRIIPHQHGRNCVQIAPFSLPEPVEEAFAEERKRIFLLSTPTYNLQTGNKDRPEDRKERKEKRRRKAETTGKRLGVPGRLRKLQRNLHDLPQKRFTSKCKAARGELAELIEERAREREGAHRTPYRSQLRAIADVPVPLYKFTKSTLRLTPAGPSIAALPKKMRQAIFDNYLEVDMSSAQLALAASLWDDLEPLREFLQVCREEEDRSWWTELIGWLRSKLPAPGYRPEEHFGVVKGILKGFTYGLFYGMEIRSLRRFGNPYDPSTDAERYYSSIRKMNRLFLGGMRHPRPWKRVTRVGDALFKHPLVKRLLSRRKKMLAKIDAQGGIDDCFGRRISTTGDRGPKSILAEYMQNAELRVMMPVGEKVLGDPELKFGLWQHDGVTIAPRRRKPWAYRQALEKAREALQRGREELAEEMDVPPIETELTVDYGEEYLES